MLVNLLAEAGRLVNKLGPCCDGPTDCNLENERARSEGGKSELIRACRGLSERSSDRVSFDTNLLGCLPLDSGQGLNGPPSPHEHGRTRVETKSVAVKHLSVYLNV